jgi:lipopolysaccharide/colanic/teichoic acid biosynthesis glycosyltransferase
MVRTENKVSTKRVYAYRRIAAAPEKKPVLPDLSYLYIGNKFRAALDLHEGFGSSHFLFSFDEAVKLLVRLEKAGRLPSVILIDGPSDISAARKFFHTLNDVEAFKTLTILADVSTCRQEMIAQLSQEPRITDLVMINTKNGLTEKTIFYNKIRKEALQSEKSLHHGISWNLVRTYGLVRVFDLVFSTICIALLSPLMLMLAILVKMDGGSTIFEFGSERGLRYRSFRYMKFRTELNYGSQHYPDLCHVNQFAVSEDQGTAYQVKGNQTSKVGSFLRATNLDELPALFNILAGDISFIRNR